MKNLIFLFCCFFAALTVQAQTNEPAFWSYSDTYDIGKTIEQSETEGADCLGQRKDVMTELTSDERALLAGLIIEYLEEEINPTYNQTTDPIYLKYDVVAQHSAYGNHWIAMAWHSNNEFFFEWHRDYIQELEQWLLNKGFDNFVPLPAWDPSSGMPDEFLGVVVNGFSTFMNDIEEGDLQMYVVDDLTCGQFNSMDEFAGFIRAGVNSPASGFTSHNHVHDEIGGAMSPPFTASGAAIFWLFHAHVDELYECYLSSCEGCDPPFVRLESGDKCSPCFSTTLSTNITSGVDVVFTDANGNAITPVIDPATGCFDHQWRQQNFTAGQTITVTASTEGCKDDEVTMTYTFPSHTIEGTGKWARYTPCWPKTIHERISPNPTTGGIV